ncbi:molybdenum-dependent transcriptional regulator [Geoglobus ahangari]|uniref:molybdenum-dependent transcriptional regulator n=1 Tax=Geoglobus ahangari TaxID=113653 RepID=UPI001FE0D05B|nr:molybdenum-dependent transcriptional regulator [Geoglobus ahangari]
MRETEELSPKLRVWLEKDGMHILGKGGAEILEAIDRYRSISAASRHLGMSYRYVWGYIKRMEEATGRKIVEARKGGKGGGEARLTEFGKELLREFERMSEFLERAEMAYEDEWGLLGVKISARNRIKARIRKVEVEGVAGKVEMVVEVPVTIKALITAEAVREMGLKEGDEVFAIIKATDIMVAKKPESVGVEVSHVVDEQKAGDEDDEAD